MQDQDEKTAGIIIIGNEILSGKVQDTNSSFLVSELRSLGVNVRCIMVIPDEIGIIGRTTREFSEQFTYVFTSGGVGPTHDDITMEGVAAGFGRSLVRHSGIVDLFHQRYGGLVNEAVLKMALIPEGAEVIDFGNLRFPLIRFRNIYIFPGIPSYLRERFAAIRETFRSSSFYGKRIYLNANESDVAETLNRVVAAFGDITFGSYPILDNPGYKIIITADSRSEESLQKAVQEFLGALPEKIVVNVE